MRNLVFLLGLSACYHYSFDQRQPPGGAQLVTRHVRTATYLNGLVGTGEVDTTKFCAEPVRTELRVRASDVALSILTLLIYTPHTLYVTCAVPDATAERAQPR
jgi:hypothetical protein